MRAGKEQEGVFLPYYNSLLMMKVLVKRIKRAGRDYNDMDHTNEKI